ncbi:ATP-dependent DNA helicase PIF1 [Fusarium oxysporum f. sp. conglutinans]|nr:ATP-dependent DNA helicase PIF1 [Fusarium oxysporum f. sp. conglutinans]KAG6992866.1 ATP-dependent DNA helicase PIF1 [Fusarium oxysporum f. sp. conglutinans]KAG6999915.1 ATP-dependent DNA helicase PIF1 [Fusarium oxysporum f. sp. conglutinans]KAG7003980.1 ATP-dependent DNA helicase PIF1 [Fusarium oxysporum f. sp. conglutinans]
MADSIPSTKICRNCKQAKPADQFISKKNSSISCGRLTVNCLDCRNRQASGTSKRTAEQAELSPIHREGLPLIGLQLRTPINPQESILLGTPIATSTRAGTPITSRPGPSIASQEGVRLGTPIESPVSSPSIWPRPARERHSRPPVQLQQSAIERPVMERRDFELPDPDWMRDLSHCPLSDRDKELLEKFWTELENDRMEHCARCQETWFDMGLKGGICKRCIARDKNKKEDEPWFFSAENQLDFGLIPAFLPQLTIVEEMLIARVHVFVNVMQVRGQQYKYRGHIVHFLRDVGKVYSQLPLLPPELDVILLRPPTASEHAHLNRQFRRQFRVRRRCLQEWLNFLSNNHPGYRGITVCQKRMSVLPEDGDVLDQVATAAVTDPLSANLGNIENDDVEPDEVDQSAVPDLLPEDTEMEALRSHVLGEERGEHLPVRPSTQHQLEMPDIRRTPINEFNHSQALLSLAFPTLFPRGQADFVEPRLRPIKYADYIQHALRWHDGRFARHPTFRFVVFNTLMRAQARAKSSYFVKEYQQRQGLITRDDLLEAFQNPESAEAQQLLNSINRQTAQLRGTRPYWYRKRRELESYAYNLDCPGAFITFSPADLHWRSLYQHLPQFQDWQELPEQQRMGMSSKLLRDNPHIAAWHFYRRFGLFRDIVLKQKFNVTDYWNRYEWQGRGSSHCHGLFWMDGAPSVDLENEHLRKEFARIWRFHVTAFNPEPARVRQQGEGNPLAVNPLQHPLTFQWLSQVLNRCQRHHCSETYCLRKKKGSEEISCRFFFPRDTRDTADVVRRQGQSYFSFEAARNDSLMNHYNRCLSLGWLANIDISPCTSLQAVINYAAKYCSKMEKRTDSYASLGRQILPNVSHQNPLLSFASRLMNKLLTERDFSGQEICHVLLNCELQEGTRVIRAVDCRPYEQQGRSLRLQGDHDDAEVVGIYEKYLSRPPLHEELTYLDFLANWNTSKRDGRKWTRWSRQAKPRVLYYFPRYKSNHQHHQYDDFCRVKLMLAHPHRDPNELRKINGVEYNSYASAAEFCYGNHRHPDDYYGTPNAEERRPDPDEFEEEFHEPDLLEEDWLELARQLPDCPPSQEAIDLLGRRDIDIQYDWTPHVGRYADPGIVQGDYWRQRIEQNRLYMDVEDMPLEVRDALNPEQRIVYDTFIGHFQCGSEEQILLHVDGGGGTGKSYMIKVLSSHLQRLAGNRPSPIWRAAPTGVASNQIMGTTLHSLLRLPMDRAFTELSPADANAIQKKLRDVRYLVIDEKSMLGLRQLSWIDKRLRQVFPARAAEFFGGISIILVGDFFQLPPIANKPLYFDGPLKDLHEVSGQTAYRAFNHTVFLKKVQRQQGDDQAGFRLALEELRGLKLSIESWKLLSQRVQVKLSQREEDTFDAALRIYSKKARVNEYNYEHLVRLKHPAIQVMAKNIGNGADKATSEQAGNLAGQFPVCIGARLMLTQNIWQPAGLVNGAQGTVYDIGWAPGADAHRDPPSVIMMVMDKYTGPSYLTTDDGREVVPILPVKRDFFLGTSACTRKQFPLMASYAITVHKSQSITVDKMVTDLSERDFQTGLSYVAVSRVKMLDGLMIDAPFERASLHYEKLPDGKHSSIMLFTLEALYVLTD